MKKLILECDNMPSDTRLFIKISSAFRNVKSYEIIRYLGRSSTELSFILQVNFLSLPLNVNDIPFVKWVKVEVIYEDVEKCALYIYVKAVFPRFKSENGKQIKKESSINDYFITKLEMDENKVRASIIGNTQSIQSFLREREYGGDNCKIISLTTAQFPSESPLNNLTNKQRDMLKIAFDCGYFEIPKKISLEKLAKKIGISKSTLNVHLNKAERAIIRSIFET